MAAIAEGHGYCIVCRILGGQRYRGPPAPAVLTDLNRRSIRNQDQAGGFDDDGRRRVPRFL